MIKFNQMGSMRIMVTMVCLIIWCLQAKADESKKKFEKTFPKEGIEELVLSNSYGKIEVTQTSAEEIAVVVEMRVSAKSGLKADETLDLIQIKETQAEHYIDLQTEFAKNMQLKQFLTSTDIHVNYKVNLPEGIKLRVISTNGDVYLGNFSGEVNADIKNGDFKATVLKGGEFYIKQSNGAFYVEDVTFMTGDFKDCTIYIEDGTEARLVTSSCDGKIESMEKLNIRSSSGVMKLGEIEELSGSSSFTKYEVQDIGNILDMDMKLGEMNVRNIQLMFSEIRLKGSFTKVGLTFATNAGYHLELKRNKSLKLDLPRDMTLEERPATERNMTIGTKFIGNTDYSGKVFLELSNGSLYIQ